MTRDESFAQGGLEGASAEAWSELCGVEDDDGEAPDEHPGYASLAGLGARKPAKKPVIVLDPEVAEKAAQVMEINAGQLVVNPGQAAHGFALLGLDPLGEDEADEPPQLLAEAEAAEEEDDDADAAVAEWAARTAEAGEENVAEEEIDEIVGEAWSGDLDEPAAPPEDEYELTVEAVEVAEEEPALDQPVLDQAIVDQAWLDWARALLEPQAAAGEAPPADKADDLFAPPEPEALVPAVDEIASPEPELPRHELRLMIAQLSRPRKSQGRRLWVTVRRFYRWVQRFFA